MTVDRAWSSSSTPPDGRLGTQGGVMRVLLVEDDEGDALLVKELLAESQAPVVLRRARTVSEAAHLLPTVDCVLLDLGLPDATGLQGLIRLRAQVPATAIVVLTGLADEQNGLRAVAAGAQDYLSKDQVDGTLLSRVIRYAVERRRTDEIQRQLHEERLYAQENTRLARGLLPSPLLSDPSLVVTPRYRPGQRRMLLGGDFYDVVQVPDGTVHAMVGDVCGHGPDEAALGVCLRVTWRAMTLAARPAAEVLATMQRVFVHERHREPLFATLCMVEIQADHSAADLYLAGHPPPLLLTPAGGDGAAAPGGGPPVPYRVRQLAAPIGVPLGVLENPVWTGEPQHLGTGWSMLLYTDGLVEGRVGPGGDRLWEDGLTRLVDDLLGADAGWRERPDELLNTLIDRVEELNGGDLLDDLAAVLISSRPDAV
jgi:serine phosphatase RsbU (regulator of sigma subunit)